MLKILKSSVRDTLIYSIGTFASKLTGFILVPLYTNRKYLSHTDFGVLNFAEANLQVLIALFGLGLSWAYERWYWDKDQIEKRKSNFFTIMVATIGLSVFMITVTFPFARPLSGMLFEEEGYQLIFKLMLLNAALEILAQTPNSLIRLNEKPVMFTMANLSKLVVAVVLTFVFVVHLELGIAGIYYAQLISIGVYFLMLSRFLIANIELKFERHELKNMVYFRFPFVLPIIALSLFNYSDRFVITKVIGIEHAGIYALGAKFANTIKVFLITAIWLALTPTIYKMINDPNNKRFYSKIMTYLAFVVLIIVMVFSFFSKELVAVVAKDHIYIGAAKVIPLIALGIFFGLLKDVSLIGLNITKRTGPIAIITISITIGNLILNAALVPFFGIIGAAWASMLSQLIFFLIIYSVAQKQYRIPYELRKICTMIGVSVLLFLLAQATAGLHVVVRLPAKLMLIAVFPFILYFLGFYENIEIERLKGFWRKWNNPGRWKQNFQKLKF